MSLANSGRLTWLNTVASSRLVSARMRRRLLRLGGVDVRAAVVGPDTTFINGSNVAIGRNSFVGSGVLFDARERIEVGERAVIGPDVVFLTSSHEIGPTSCRAGVPIYAPIVVEERACIGAGAVILGGVTIGAGCRIEAGALVNRNCEPNGLYAGIPARREDDLSTSIGIHRGIRPVPPGPVPAANSLRHRLVDSVRQLWTNSIVGSWVVPMRLRRRLLRLAGMDNGKCGIWPGVRFVGGSRVAVGDQSFISSAVFFDASAGVRIGARVAVGPRASFVTSIPEEGCGASRADGRPATSAPVIVEDGCWIGASAVISPGVIVGRGCVIAARAAVTSSCEPNGLYVGIPASRKKDLQP